MCLVENLKHVTFIGCYRILFILIHEILKYALDNHYMRVCHLKQITLH